MFETPASDSADCRGGDHLWELRGVSFDLQVGALEEYECTGCPAVNVRQAAAGLVRPV